MITVMGATGNTGKPVCEALLKKGEKIRVIGRSKEKLKPWTDRGAEAAIGDITDAVFLTQAFKGADAVYVMVPPDYQATDYFGYYNRVSDAIEHALRKNGTRFAVMLSSLGAELPSGTGLIVGLHNLEERLKKNPSLNLVILRAGYFFDNHFGTLGLIKSQGINGGAIAPDVPLSMTSTEDIGEAAAEALHQRNFKGLNIREILGPKDLSLRETTKILGAKIGKPDLNYVQFKPADFEKALVGMGFSEAVSHLFSEMSQALSEQKVRSLAGRNAENTTKTSFESFADRWAQAYRAN